MRYLYNLANLNILIDYKFKYTYRFLEDFLCEDNLEPDIFISVSDGELLKELEISEIKILDVVENSLILRKIANVLIKEYSTVLFHASAIKYNNNAYLFTAPSGTGKSTHTALLKELLLDKIEYINDDKPFISYNDGKFIVHGSPWRGKHRLGGNVSAPLKAIIKVKRSKVNEVKSLNPIESLNLLLEQAYSYNDEETANILFELINNMLKEIDFYELSCNMDVSAPKTSFEKILKGE